MIYQTEISSVFNCSLERAFKSPMLCDVKKVHTGFLIMPALTHCEDDSDWGKPDGSRRVFMKKNIVFKGGEAALDTVVDRKENEYWKIRIDNFKMLMMGIHMMEGEWFTRKLSDHKIQVDYRYTISSDYKILEPLLWWFTHTFWKVYMKHALHNIKAMAEGDEPFVFE